MREILHSYWIPIVIAAIGILGWVLYRIGTAFGGAIKSEEDSDER